jgi:hypothetical protein
MAQSDKPDLTPDPLAPAAGDQPPDAVPIYGILGKSPVASSVRLFLDVGLTTYYDIPNEGIVKREKVPADQSPLGVDSSLLFVLKGIQLTVHHVQTRSVEEEFLSGDFTAPGTFTPTTAVGGLPGVGARIPNTAATVCTQLGCPNTAATVCTRFGPCLTRFNVCPTRFGICPTRFGPCPTRIAPCPTRLPHQCGSALDACPTRIPQQCGSALDACISSLGCTRINCHSQFPACRPTLATVCTLQLCPPPPSVDICVTLLTQIDCPME